MFNKINISQNLWECLITIERLKQNAWENMVLTVADVLRPIASLEKKYAWDVSLNNTGEQLKNLAKDFSNWDLRVYSRELEGPQE